MPTTQTNPTPYFVNTKSYLNSTFITIVHEDYPGAATNFQGTEYEAQLEATRLNGKVAERLQRQAPVMTTYTLTPRGLADRTDPRVMAHEGAEVRKIQPVGCPRNGTMGHTYVERVDTGEFIGLVLETSLETR